MAANDGGGDDLILRVGYKTIGAALTANTMPTIVMAAQWLNDGAYELMRKVNPILIPEMIKAPMAVASVAAALESDYFKMVSVYDDNGQFKYIDPLSYGMVETDKHSHYGKSSHIYTLMDDKIYIASSVSLSNAKQIYIKKLPVTIAAASAAVTMSYEMHGMIVDYAVAQSKKMEEEIQQYAAYMQMWYQKIIMMNQTALVETMM